jgi:hypothetical protein
LELPPAGSLYAVGTLFGEPPEGAVYFSPEWTERRDGTDVLLDGIALTDQPAQICLTEVAVYPGDLRAWKDWPVPERHRWSSGRLPANPVRERSARRLRRPRRAARAAGGRVRRAGRAGADPLRPAGAHPQRALTG